MISDEDERDVLDVLMTVCDLIPDKYDKSSFKYRVILSVMISTRLVDIERVRIENEGDYEFTKEFGCGFISTALEAGYCTAGKPSITLACIYCFWFLPNRTGR